MKRRLIIEIDLKEDPEGQLTNEEIIEKLWDESYCHMARGIFEGDDWQIWFNYDDIRIENLTD